MTDGTVIDFVLVVEIHFVPGKFWLFYCFMDEIELFVFFNEYDR